MKRSSTNDTTDITDDVRQSYYNWLHAVHEFEKDQPDNAIKEYEKLTRAFPLKETPYDRLMILYRKAKDYDKELTVVNRAIGAFEKHYGKTEKSSAGKISNLSKKISKSMGLVDKKGQPVYDHEPIARWKKRKNLIEKKLKG